MKKIIIILIILASLTFCSKVQEVNNLIKESKELIRQNRFREAKFKLDSAKKINQRLKKEGKSHLSSYTMERAYDDLDFNRKRDGTISDSLVAKIIKKYDININYYKDGEGILSYGDKTNGLYFYKVSDGIGYLNMKFTYVVEEENPLNYVEDIEVYANGKMFVRDYDFFNILDEWIGSARITRDRELILNIACDNEILIRFCGLDSNTEYRDVWAKIDTNIYKAYKEIRNNYW